MWIGPKDGCGYGKLFVSGRYVGAHRVAMMRHLNRELSRNEQVLHRCDTPPCCNPTHLFLGTPATNCADRAAKGRNGKRLMRGPDWNRAHANDMRCGEANGNAKITDEQARSIVCRYANGESRAELAREYSVSWTCINQITSGHRQFIEIDDEKK
jgi:hypothetical protein